MISKLKKLDNLIVSEKCLENAQRFDDIGQYLLIIYYLKLYYAEHFDYSLWNPKRNLSDALYELEAYKENSNKDYSQLVSCLKLSYDDLRRFHNIMVKSGIPMSLNDKRNLDKIIKNMKEAIIIFPDDMWPLYWLAYAETLSGDYNAAILHWELLLKNPLSMSLETLPIAYEMLGKCYAETGELNRSKEIIGSISSLRTEKNIDFNCFPDL
jgi:tetratricopeptide (TPR) repeat protein